MGRRSRHTTQEVLCLLEMNVRWCKKGKSIPEQQQRTFGRCWRIQIQKDLKQVLCQPERPLSKEVATAPKATQQGSSHCSKGHSAKKWPLLQNRHKKPDYSLPLHMETDVTFFGVMSSGLMKHTWNCLAMMAIVMFEGKRGEACQRQNTIPTTVDLNPIPDLNSNLWAEFVKAYKPDSVTPVMSGRMG